MKLLFCRNCAMVFSISKAYRECNCGKTWGKYLDNRTAVYGGPCTPLGFANAQFLIALDKQPDAGSGKTFEAFVIPKNCRTFVRGDNDALVG